MMKTQNTHKELLVEMDELRLGPKQIEENQCAIRREVAALVVPTGEGNRILTLKGAEHLYRTLVEMMHEGAVTVGSNSCIVYCNGRFASMIGAPVEQLTGKKLLDIVVSDDAPLLTAMLDKAVHVSAKGYVSLRTFDGQEIPVHMSCVSIDLEGVAGVSIIVTDLSRQW